jgi:hypothetical protein
MIRPWLRRWPIPVLLLALTPAAHAETLLETLVGVLVDGGNDFTWEKVEPDGATCGNGSPYKFFVHRTGSSRLLFMFEGGGACWDYDTCSGRAGVLGAANPNGIADDHMQGVTAQFVSPLVNGADPGLPLHDHTSLPTAGWNVVYLPYCTGDVHLGNSVTTYQDPTGAEPPLSWRHVGYGNTLAAVQWTASQFPALERLLVSGYSAGGTASLAAYYFVRHGIGAAEGFLLDDSGPIFLAPGPGYPSRPLHERIRSSWGLDPVLAQLPGSFDPGDFGSVNAMVAREFPGDQIAYTGFSSDYNFSRFSYERFMSPHDKDTVLRTWREDQSRLLAELQGHDNVSYFVPWERPINDSHCSTIITFIGSQACTDIEKKRHWWEYLEPPWEQTWRCYGETVPMATFLDRFINQGVRTRIVEPQNGYNDADPGMAIIAPLINAAIGP